MNITPLTLLEYLLAAVGAAFGLAIALWITLAAISAWRDNELRRRMGVLHPDVVKALTMSGVEQPVDGATKTVPAGEGPYPHRAAAAPARGSREDLKARKIYGGPES